MKGALLYQPPLREAGHTDLADLMQQLSPDIDNLDVFQKQFPKSQMRKNQSSWESFCQHISTYFTPCLSPAAFYLPSCIASACQSTGNATSPLPDSLDWFNSRIFDQQSP